METKLNLYQKLMEIKKAFPSYIKKTAEGYGFKYCKESILNAIINPVMEEHGILLYQEVISLEDCKITRVAKDKSTQELTGSRMHLQYTWVNIENPSETLKCSQWIQDYESDAQKCGGLLTYGVRYFLLKFFNIATDDIDIDTFDRNVESFTSQPKKIKTFQLNDLKNTIKPYEEHLTNQILKKYDVKKLEDLSEDEYSDARKNAIIFIDRQKKKDAEAASENN